MNIIFMRHGETILNKEEIFCGRIDCSLTNEAKSKAKYSKFKNGDFDYIYTSSLKRAIETAELVYPYKKPMINDYIIERNLGEFEGKLKKEVDSTLIELFRKNKYIPKGAETIEEVNKRIQYFLEYLKKNHKNDDKILVITHAGILRQIKKNYLNSNDYFFKNFEKVEINI